MTEEQKLIYLRGRLLEAEIRMQGMIAANSQSPDSQPYMEKDFVELITTFGIHHNALLGEMFNQ